MLWPHPVLAATGNAKKPAVSLMGSDGPDEGVEINCKPMLRNVITKVPQSPVQNGSYFSMRDNDSPFT